MAAPRELDLTVTLESALEMWEQDLRRRVSARTLSPETLRNYVQYAARVIQKLGPTRTCDSVSADEIVEMLADARGAGQWERSVSTAQQFHKGIRGLMHFADSRRWLRENPMRDVARPNGRSAHATRPERKALTRPELDAMIAAARNGHASRQGGRASWVRDEIVIRLAGESGLRNADIQNLDLDDIDATPSGAWVAQIRCGKGRKSRTVPLSDACAKLIQEYVENHRPEPGGFPDRADEFGKVTKGDAAALLLTSATHRLNHSAVLLIVKNAARYALGRHYVPHGLRHTTGTLLAREAKADPALIAHVLGHSDISVTSVYLDTSEDEAVAAVNRRKVSARSKAPKTLPPGPGAPVWPDCGTRQGFNRHQREKIPRCTACLLWHREAQADREKAALRKALDDRERECEALLMEVRDLRDQLNSRRNLHGTAWAYREHRRLREQPCPECRDAYQASQDKRSPCGSEAGAQWHRHWGEPECDACSDARRASRRARKNGLPGASGIRMWARMNGFVVSAQGRLPGEVVRAWAEAQVDDAYRAGPAAARVPGKPAEAPRTAGYAEIRAWACANGHPIAPRGRISSRVLAAYCAAHAAASAEAPESAADAGPSDRDKS